MHSILLKCCSVLRGTYPSSFMQLKTKSRWSAKLLSHSWSLRKWFVQSMHTWRVLVQHCSNSVSNWLTIVCYSWVLQLYNYITESWNVPKSRFFLKYSRPEDVLWLWPNLLFIQPASWLPSWELLQFQNFWTSKRKAEYSRKKQGIPYIEYKEPPRNSLELQEQG